MREWATPQEETPSRWRRVALVLAIAGLGLLLFALAAGALLGRFPA